MEKRISNRRVQSLSSDSLAQDGNIPSKISGSFIPCVLEHMVCVSLHFNILLSANFLQCYRSAGVYDVSRTAHSTASLTRSMITRALSLNKNL